MISIIIILIIILCLFYLLLNLRYNEKFINNDFIKHDNNIKNDLIVNELDDYMYYKTSDDEYIYYINMIHGLDYGKSSYFIDKNKKILDFSRHYFCDIDTDIDYNNLTKIMLANLSDELMNNAIDIGENIIAITKWFITYGHVHDEFYNLYDFYSKISQINPDINFKILHEYHTDNLITTYPAYQNYNTLKNYLFEDKFINPYDYKYNILKMKKLYLIKSNYYDKVFHNFPFISKNKILSKIPDNNIIVNKNIFINRGKAVHLPRNILNEDEICEYLKNNNYSIINPEILSLDDFINIVKNADNIVINWGGALTNMVYFKENTNVYILKSKSYDSESIEIFSKIISNYKLNITIINNIDNIIILPFLN